MKINRRTEWQMTDEIGEYILLCKDSYEYRGRISRCFGGRSTTTAVTETVQDIDTTQFAQEDITGIGLQAGGDIEFTQEVTDLGAVQGAFDVVGGTLDFAGETVGEGFGFGRDALAFAESSQEQASAIAQRAIGTSQQAVATVATGGATDLAGINQRTVAVIAAAAAAIFIIPQVIRRTA